MTPHIFMTLIFRARSAHIDSFAIEFSQKLVVGGFRVTEYEFRVQIWKFKWRIYYGGHEI